ncbi:MAG: prephenate dehydrogenase/arogenate dehydrogenase family protein [Candidatus Acidiferrales bacterium]
MAGTLPFRRVAVIGTGLIGGSFALALRKHFPDVSIIGFDRPDVLQRAAARGAIDDAASDIGDALRDADLVYLALPIIPTIDILQEVAKFAEPDAMITDACSTKTAICHTAREAFRRGAQFLGGHPMAGKEQSGIGHADAELFRDAPYALIGSDQPSDARAKSFAELLLTIGARPVWCDAETHDWAVGIVSHLPQLVSIALARVVQDETDETGLPLSLAGQGLQDMLRLAGSPYGVWRDILLTNTENLSRALDRLQQTIDYLRTRLAMKELEQEFEAANEIYKQLQKPR